MIKDTRYIIKRVIIGVLISLILSFIYACDVKAQTYTYYPSNTSVHYYSSNTDYSNRLPFTSQGNMYFYHDSGRGDTSQTKFVNDVNLTFNMVSLVTFNYAIKTDPGANNQEVIIRNVSFMDMPCHYTSTSIIDNNNNEWGTSISAICEVGKAMTIPANSNIISVGFDPIGVNRTMLSTINFVDNEELLRSIRNKLNDLNANLSDVNTILQRTENINIDIRNKLNDLISAMNNQTNTITGSINNQTDSITNSQKETTDAIKETNDTLKDSNVSIDSLPSDNVDMGPLSAIVTLPITALNNIVNAFSGTCTPFNIGSLLGTNLVFPCIDIESFIGSFLWNTIDIIVTGIFIFSIRQKFVDLFYKLVTLKDIGLKGGF